MKKTFTTISSLALAFIMVSSLSSGVILADDDDDKKDRRRGREREVVIFDCTHVPTVPILLVSAADSSMGAPEIVPSDPPDLITPCAQTFADLLDAKFKVEDITTVIDLMGGVITTRYTMIKK